MVAVLIYGLSTLYFIFIWNKGLREANRINYLLVFCGYIFHTLAVVMRGQQYQRCPVNNLYEAVTFVLWAMVSVYLVVGLWGRLRFLGAFLSPLLFTTGVFSLMKNMDPPHAAIPEYTGGLASLHASLILLSYGAFGLSAVAGVMYLIQERGLKAHRTRAILSKMPSITRLETSINSLLLWGFIFLTVGLSLSPILLYKTYQVYFNADPKLIWSVIVWGAYFALLFMRWKFEHGGRKFAWGAVAGFAFILLTFWGVNAFSPAHNP